MSDCGKGLFFKRPSLVKVQFADDCDISVIVKRFVNTGELPNLGVRTPLAITDATMLPEDFSEMQEMRVRGVRLFESEPPALQEFFNHDVERYFDWRALDDDARAAYIRDNAPLALRELLLPSAPADPVPADPVPSAPPVVQSDGLLQPSLI